MSSLSVNSATNTVMQAALANVQTQDRYSMAVLAAAQDAAQQQGAAAVQLIEAATENLVDVRV